jgi:outer membrane protein assembly factor BamA
MDQFFYAQDTSFYDAGYGPYISRDMAVAVRTNRGISGFGIYPFDRFRRIELSGGYSYTREQYNDAGVAQVAADYQQQLYGRQLFRTGWATPLSAAFVQETTVFREFGPLSGNTMRLSYSVAPKIGGSLSWQTIDADVRKYARLLGSSLLALRVKGFKSWGASPDFTYFGGNHEMRGYDYLEFVGQNAIFADAELRIPLIDAMATPIGILGGVRGVVFFNIGGAWFDKTGFRFSEKRDEIINPVVSFDQDPYTGAQIPVYGDPLIISGFRLVGGRASYGIGLETFALGFPIHFDWSKRTMFNPSWEEAIFGPGGSDAFRKARFQFWIGYDF